MRPKKLRLRKNRTGGKETKEEIKLYEELAKQIDQAIKNEKIHGTDRSEHLTIATDKPSFFEKHGQI